MRRKTLVNIADELFWLVVALLPVLFYIGQFLIYKFDNLASEIPSFYSYLASFGILTDSVVYTTLADIFGTNGVLPLFAVDSPVLLFLSYFIIVMIVHVAVDVLVWIPRLSHKWISELTFTK